MSSHRSKFAALYVALGLVAAAFLAGAVVLAQETRPAAHRATAPHYTVAEADWGHVRPYRGLLQFMLGPAADQRRRYELGLERVTFTAAALAVADDDHGHGLVRIEGQPQTRCLYHAQGAAVNVVIAIGPCVPAWAKTPDGKPAAEWIRVENLAPRPRVVFLKYPPL